MNRESRTYIRNVMKGRDFLLDFTNAAIAVGIIVMVILNAFGVTPGIYFIQIFVFGAILGVLNCIKKLRAKSGFAVAFGLFALLMTAMAVLCYLKL